MWNVGSDFKQVVGGRIRIQTEVDKIPGLHKRPGNLTSESLSSNPLWRGAIRKAGSGPWVGVREDWVGGGSAQMARGGGLLLGKRIRFLSLHSWNEGPGAKQLGPGRGQPTSGT